MFAMATIDTIARLRNVVLTIWVMSTLVGVIGISQFHGAEPRAVGLSGDPNFFAALQVICLPIVAVLATQATTARIRRLVLVGLAVIVGSIFTSVSRGGLLGLAAVLLLLVAQPARTFFKTRARKSAFIAVAGTGAAILLIVSYSALSARTESLSSSGSSGSGRAYLWSAATVAFDEHPALGLGFGAFASQSNALLRRTPGVNFRQYKLRPEGQPVHNSYLESFTELGVLGGLLFIGLLASAAVSLQWAARRAAKQDDLFLLAFARALQLSLLGFAVTSIFLSAETHRTLWVLLGLSLALTRIVAARETKTAGEAA
jgi:O-antigen ligase